MIKKKQFWKRKFVFFSYIFILISLISPKKKLEFKFKKKKRSLESKRYCITAIRIILA